MRDAGAGWVLINFRLGGCYSDWTSVGCNGRTALQAYEPLVQWAATNNLKIVGLIANESWPGTQADWTARNVENNPTLDSSNPYIQGFVAGAVTPLVRQFNQRVTSWEIWNQPNAWTGHDASGNPIGGTLLYPSNFAQRLRQSRTAIRQTLGTSAVVVARAFWFNVEDIPEAWPSLYHGLVDSDGVRKPSFGAFQTYATW